MSSSLAVAGAPPKKTRKGASTAPAAGAGRSAVVASDAGTGSGAGAGTVADASAGAGASGGATAPILAFSEGLSDIRGSGSSEYDVGAARDDSNRWVCWSLAAAPA